MSLIWYTLFLLGLVVWIGLIGSYILFGLMFSKDAGRTTCGGVVLAGLAVVVSSVMLGWHPFAVAFGLASAVVAGGILLISRGGE